MIRFQQRGAKFGAAVRVRCGPLRGYQASSGEIFIYRDSAMKRAAFQAANQQSGLVCIGPGFDRDGLTEYLDPQSGKRFWLGEGSDGTLWHRSELHRRLNRLLILCSMTRLPRGIQASFNNSLALHRGMRSIHLGNETPGIFLTVIADLLGNLTIDERVYLK